jgi:hypothetical protein
LASKEAEGIDYALIIPQWNIERTMHLACPQFERHLDKVFQSNWGQAKND